MKLNKSIEETIDEHCDALTIMDGLPTGDWQYEKRLAQEIFERHKEIERILNEEDLNI